MTVASRAVAMAVMTEARAVDVEQEGHALHWAETVVQSGTAGIHNNMKRSNMKGAKFHLPFLFSIPPCTTFQ